MFKLSDYDFFEVSDFNITIDGVEIIETRVKFSIKGSIIDLHNQISDRTFMICLDKEATLLERTFMMNCKIYELIYMETEEDKEAFGEVIEIELEDAEEIEEILSDEVEQHIIDLIEALND